MTAVQGGVEMKSASREVELGSGTLLGFDLCERLDSFNADFDLLYAMIPRRRARKAVAVAERAARPPQTLPRTSLGSAITSPAPSTIASSTKPVPVWP